MNSPRAERRRANRKRPQVDKTSKWLERKNVSSNGVESVSYERIFVPVNNG